MWMKLILKTWSFLDKFLCNCWLTPLAWASLSIDGSKLSFIFHRQLVEEMQSKTLIDINLQLVLEYKNLVRLFFRLNCEQTKKIVQMAWFEMLYIQTGFKMFYVCNECIKIHVKYQFRCWINSSRVYHVTWK